MHNPLDRDFSTLSLLKFALPTTCMMVFLSLYTMVDALFVSNFVSEDAFSAINIVYPYISVNIAIGMMFSSGGSALVSRMLGEGKEDDANRTFTLITLVALGVGLVLSVIALVATMPLSQLLGSTPRLDADCYAYLFPLALFLPMLALQLLAQVFFVVAGRPNLGLLFGILGGIANIALDYLFIVVWHWGVAGAAYATGIGYSVPAIAFVLFFAKRKTGLHFARPTWSIKSLGYTCFNGSSEMVSNLSNAITNVLFNLTILVFAGEAGVAAVGVLLYAQFLLMSVFLGYAQGVSPIFGFAFGAGNTKRLQKTLRTSILVILITSLTCYAISLLCADPIIGLFVAPETETFALSKSGFGLFSLCYLFMGINLFASSFFTALSNGKVSATISFLRTLVFVVLALLLLPRFVGINGVWLALPVAEFGAMFVSIFFLVRGKRQYQY